MWPDVPEVRQIEAWLDPGIDLLNKPFIAAALATKIRELLDKPDPRRYTPACVMGHEGQFPPPRLSGRSVFSEETFAGRYGDEKDAP